MLNISIYFFAILNGMHLFFYISKFMFLYFSKKFNMLTMDVFYLIKITVKKTIQDIITHDPPKIIIIC